MLDQPRAHAAVSDQAGEPPALPAPAVAAAVRILDHLAKDAPRAGVTEIARALGINKSTCFNILLTLSHFGVIAKLPGGAKYQLGPRLAEWGGALRRQYVHRELLRRQFRPLVAKARIVCVIGQALGDETSFAIIDQIAPAGLRSRHPAPPIGSVFPLTGPALGCALLSRFEDEHALAIVRRLSPRSKPVDETAWRQRLREVRRLGYARSLEQYAPGVNAVAAPIAQDGEPYLVVGLIGHARDLTARRIETIGPELARMALELSAGLPSIEPQL